MKKLAIIFGSLVMALTAVLILDSRPTSSSGHHLKAALTGTSKIAPVPSRKFIPKALDLAAYSTSSAVTPSEEATPQTLPDGTVISDTSSPMISQQQAVEDATSQGFSSATDSTEQPSVTYGVVSNPTMATAAEPPSTGTPSIAGEKLLYQNVPVWITEYTDVPVTIHPTSGGTESTSQIGNLFIFINSSNGSYLYAVAFGHASNRVPTATPTTVTPTTASPSASSGYDPAGNNVPTPGAQVTPTTVSPGASSGYDPAGNNVPTPGAQVK